MAKDRAISHGLVQSGKFVEFHGGKLGDISIYLQEDNASACYLTAMNFVLRCIKADFGPEYAAIYRRELRVFYNIACCKTYG